MGTLCVYVQPPITYIVNAVIAMNNILTVITESTHYWVVEGLWGLGLYRACIILEYLAQIPLKPS